MTPEKSNFYISNDITIQVFDEARSEGKMDFIRSNRRRASDQHQIFHKYIENRMLLSPNHSSTYELTSLIAYSSVTKQLNRNEETIELEKKDEISHDKTAQIVFDDSRINNVKWVKGVARSTDATPIRAGLGYFLSILKVRAPHLHDEVRKEVLMVDERNDTIDALRGYYDGFMFFYLKYLKMREHNETPHRHKI